MKTKDIKLIHESIRIWMKKALNLGDAPCPLCNEYCCAGNEPEYDDCTHCPIKADTGQPDCDGTPFYDVIRYASYKGQNTASLEEIVTTHKAEINYLISILPEDEQWKYT